MSIDDAVRDAAAALSPAERRVAAVVASDPGSIAFGTVAALADRSGTSGPTVVRVARKLGFDGFRDLQAAVREEYGGHLRPAAERIRATAARRDDPLARAAAVEVANVEQTMAGIPAADFTTAVRLLTERRSHVLVLAGDAERGIAGTFADLLGQLRDGVEILDGTPPRVVARAALAGPGDVALVVDVRRYDTWVLDTARDLRDAGARVIAVTDGHLSPLADGAAVVFPVVAEGTGPFDSHVGTLALLHALVAGVADRLRSVATDRLDRVEAAWRRAGSLTE
jgi:DNA-binding MurR/RpiR family transcriptional regulator